MRAWELLAAVTTTTTTTTTSTTTTTIVQSVGGQGGNGSSGVWVPLLAALLGAVVGGFASAVGSYVLHLLQLKKTTRIRIYDELLPALFEQYRRIVRAMHVLSQSQEWYPAPPGMNLLEDAGELRRAGIIAGGREAQITERIWTLLSENTAYVVGLGGTTLRWEPDEPEAIRAAYEELESLADSLHRHLERKLTSKPRRLIANARAWTAANRRSAPRKQEGAEE
jgi:hypothetical protein